MGPVDAESDGPNAGSGYGFTSRRVVFAVGSPPAWARVLGTTVTLVAMALAVLVVLPILLALGLAMLAIGIVVAMIARLRLMLTGRTPTPSRSGRVNVRVITPRDRS